MYTGATPLFTRWDGARSSVDSTAGGSPPTLAGCFSDYRNPNRVEHEVRALLAQRTYALALGYEDLNDHDQLRGDRLLALLVGKSDLAGVERGYPLAGSSTLNRLELGTAKAAADRYKRIAANAGAMDRLRVDVFVESYTAPPREVWLDLDATDDPTHGRQEGRFFHGYYRHYCYLPLYIFCGEHLLCARLRPSNIDASAGSVEELTRIVALIRQRWPNTRIVIRGDSGFCRESIMNWCETQGIGYLFGLARNARLVRALGRELHQAQAVYRHTGEAARCFSDFRYRTRKSWSRSRRVVGKAEHLSKGPNPRFVVTNLSAERADAKRLYEELYCARGDLENRIKEQQLGLFADRTSSATLQANQLRLYFASFAYLLMHGLRRLGPAGTAYAKAQCTTIRAKLLKIGARVRVTVRKVWLSFSESYPYANAFARILANLRTLPPWPAPE